MDVILILGVLIIGLVYFFYKTGKETGKVNQPEQTPIVKLGPEPDDTPTPTVVEQPVVKPAGEEPPAPKKRTRKPAAKPAAMKAPAKPAAKKPVKKTAKK